MSSGFVGDREKQIGFRHRPDQTEIASPYPRCDQYSDHFAAANRIMADAGSSDGRERRLRDLGGPLEQLGTPGLGGVDELVE